MASYGGVTTWRLLFGGEPYLVGRSDDHEQTEIWLTVSINTQKKRLVGKIERLAAGHGVQLERVEEEV